MEDRANSEKDRLATATGLPAMVHSTDSGYEVILGKFSSRAAAEKRAAKLVESSQLTQAQVVARPE